MNFNQTKTESLLITTKIYSSIPSLVFDGKIVTEVNSHKHLGIIITTDLTWTAHIDAICSKALKRLDILRSLKYTLPRRALEQIYFTFIRPIIEYGDVIYDGCGVLNMEM